MRSCRVSAAALAAIMGLGAAGAQPPGLGIAVAELSAVDAVTVSALGADEAAFPRSLWSPLDIEAALALVGRVDGPGRSLVASELAGRALASGAAAPYGSGDRKALAVRRLAALEALGRSAAVDAIVSVAPGARTDPALAGFGARAKLARGGSKEGCAVVEAMEKAPDAAFWGRMRAACYALAGEAAAADLTLNALAGIRAEGADAVFAEWIGRATGARKGGKPPAPRDAIELALAVKAGEPLAPELVDALPLATAAGLAEWAEAPAPLRLAAARRAARQGALTMAALRAALAAAAGPPDGRPASDLLAAAETADGVQRAILLHQAVARAATPVEKADTISAALEDADSAAGFVVQARLYTTDIKALVPSPQTAAFAALFAEALAVAGESALARAWLDFRVAPSGGPDALIEPAEPAGSAEPLDPVERSAIDVLVAVADPSIDAAGLAAAARARLDAVAGATEPEKVNARRDVFLLLALGAPSDGALRAAAAGVSAGGAGADEGALFALEAAIHEGALAEAALYAQRALAVTGGADPAASARAARALLAMGLEAEGRALVIEAILTARRGG